MIEIGTAAFRLVLGRIVFADILLAGDNVVVIALAVRSLSARLQKKAIVWGTLAAVLFRIALTLVAARLLTQPYLKILGAIGAVLVVPIG
jgi:predicted tellurium resistance membrane protein TerC